ncbi:MAG: Smr/MutS family protein [Alphaproteobacteria bacterium]|nr:Smr/MutS family protein [Alphaproteobacteria bacterium]MCL2758326.1 Smr/MutS family protein [Alphaproteobacteria bacterium]
MKPHKRQLSDKDLDGMVDAIPILSRHSREGGNPLYKMPPRQSRDTHCTGDSRLRGNDGLDLHGLTEEQAWNAIVGMLGATERYAAANGNKINLRRIRVITGASGVLKQKLQQWATESIIAPRIVSCKLVNNGCYEVVARKALPACPKL